MRHLRSCSELVEACKLQLCAFSHSEETGRLTQGLTIRVLWVQYAQRVSKISSATLHCFNPDIYGALINLKMVSFYSSEGSISPQDMHFVTTSP